MKAKAMVTVMVDVELTDIWGEDCTIGQVEKQAKDSALNQLSQMFNNTPDISLNNRKPKVEIIILDRPK